MMVKSALGKRTMPNLIVEKDESSAEESSATARPRPHGTQQERTFPRQGRKVEKRLRGKRRTKWEKVGHRKKAAHWMQQKGNNSPYSFKNHLQNDTPSIGGGGRQTKRGENTRPKRGAKMGRKKKRSQTTTL